MNTTNSLASTNSVRPEPVEGFYANTLAVVLKLYQEIFQKFEIFCKNEYEYSDKRRGQLIESLLLAQILEHATLLRELTESKQRIYAPLAAVFRGLYESAVKLIWLLLEHPDVNRHKQLERSSIVDEWKLKKDLKTMNVLSSKEFLTQEDELVQRLQKINSEYTLKNSNETKLLMQKITTDIEPYFRDSKKDLYVIYRIYSGSLHGNLNALGCQYIKNGSICLFNHSPERFIEIYGLSNEILESIIQLFQKTKSNPSTSSGRTDFGRTSDV